MELKPCITQKKNPCNELLLIDKTDYAGNSIDPNDVVLVELFIKPSNYTTPVKFEFTVLSGTVTDAERTDQNGNVSNVLADVNDVNFPFTDLNLPSLLVFGSQNYVDIRMEITYKVTLSDTTVYQEVVTLVTLCEVIKCFNDAMSKYTKKKLLSSSAIQVAAKFYALTSAIYTGNINDIDTNLESIKKACNNCGCGC
jgi:hypothetical protein